MDTERLGAFSDGVLAIIITIMVLELHVPHSAMLADLQPLLPPFLSYALSFIYVGIYWNNHHHMLQTMKRITGGILWANMHLLFWLSLVPFATAWVGENHLTTWPSAVYGFVLLMASIAYFILQNTIIHSQGRNSLLGKAVGRDLKGMLSPVFYAAAIGLAFFKPILANIIYALVACMWLIPDRRIERVMKDS